MCKDINLLYIEFIVSFITFDQIILSCSLKSFTIVNKIPFC